MLEAWKVIFSSSVLLLEQNVLSSFIITLHFHATYWLTTEILPFYSVLFICIYLVFA